MPLVVAQSRFVVQMAQICNMINTLKRTPFFTFLMLPPHQCCSQAGCTYRNIIVGNQFLLTEFKRTCRPLMILSLSLSLLSLCILLSFSLSLFHTHTQSLIDQRDRMRTGCGLYLSLSLTTLTYTHTHQICSDFSCFTAMLQMAADLVRSGGSISRN